MAVDARHGIVATAGWLETRDLTHRPTRSARCHERGRNIIYTSVERDGMLEGPDTVEVSEIASAAGESLLIYAGESARSRIYGLSRPEAPRLAGVVTGKALYEGRFTIAEASAVLCS